MSPPTLYVGESSVFCHDERIALEAAHAATSKCGGDRYGYYGWVRITQCKALLQGPQRFGEGFHFQTGYTALVFAGYIDERRRLPTKH